MNFNVCLNKQLQKKKHFDQKTAEKKKVWGATSKPVTTHPCTVMASG